MLTNNVSIQPSAFKKAAAAGRKPNSVSRLRPCGLRRDDDHSSGPVITGGIKRPTRRLWTGRPVTPPYLALLRAGFCLPPVLPRARCALTAPFHPYSPSPARLRERAPAEQACDDASTNHLGPAPPKSAHRKPADEGGRYVFCATFLQVTLTGRYPAHCPAEFGLSSPLVRQTIQRTCGAAVWPAAIDQLYSLRPGPAWNHPRLVDCSDYPSVCWEIWYCSSFL